MCCGRICMKKCNVFFGTLLLVICLSQILCAIYMLIHMYKINRPETIGHQYISIPSLSMILLGIVLLPLIFMGCCGILKEVACFINLYSSVLLLLSVVQVLVGIFSVVTFMESNTNLSVQIKEDVTYSFSNFQKDPKFLNSIQNELHCCGIVGPTDWKTLPVSCCGDNEVQCSEKSNFLYKDGCAVAVTNFTIFWNAIIGYSLVAVGIIEFLAAILGFTLGCGCGGNKYIV